jgi:predicted nucleic acid-binding Zn ribbon protein
MKDDPIKTCGRCGQEVARLISSPAIMFKGSGWYVTDYSDKLKPTGDTEGSEKANDKPEDGKKKEVPATTTAVSPAPSSSGESSAPSTAPAPSTSGTSTPSSHNPSSTSSSSSSS